MIRTYYVCPNCETSSSKMQLLSNSKYDPQDEKRNEDIPGFAPIKNELLRCPCGSLLTWYDMQPRNARYE